MKNMVLKQWFFIGKIACKNHGLKTIVFYKDLDRAPLGATRRSFQGLGALKRPSKGAWRGPGDP